MSLVSLDISSNLAELSNGRTNHFDPNSVLFNPSQRNAVIASNLGIFAMIWAVTYGSTVWGTGEVIKYYMFPWLCVSHWFIMITYVSCFRS